MYSEKKQGVMPLGKKFLARDLPMEFPDVTLKDYPGSQSKKLEGTSHINRIIKGELRKGE